MRGAYYEEQREHAGAGTEAPRDFGVFDPDIGLPRPRPENAADVPAPREIRVERERTVNQRHHRADILAEIGQRFWLRSPGPPGRRLQLQELAARNGRLLDDPPRDRRSDREEAAENSRTRPRRVPAVMRIARDRLL